jgi:hypothetical protein
MLVVRTSFWFIFGIWKSAETTQTDRSGQGVTGALFSLLDDLLAIVPVTARSTHAKTF